MNKATDIHEYIIEYALSYADIGWNFKSEFYVVKYTRCNLVRFLYIDKMIILIGESRACQFLSQTSPSIKSAQSII